MSALSDGLSGKMLVMSWERLGREVRLRRQHLDLTQPEMAKRGPLSVTTIRYIENNRIDRLSRRSREALDRALNWAPGSTDAVLSGGTPIPVGGTTMPAAVASPADSDPAAAVDRFDKARWILRMRRSFAEHREGMNAAARAALDEEFTTAAREIEQALIWMLPWLGDKERAEAIKILAELRDN